MRLVIDRLIAEEGLAASYFDVIPVEFRPQGLLVDTELGHVIKVDRHGRVSIAYRSIDGHTLRACAHYGDMDVITCNARGPVRASRHGVCQTRSADLFGGRARVDEMNRRTLWAKFGTTRTACTVTTR